uniref:Uncharacterized protein n=1 Tax=Rhizophora mucronata TaxID=61149 RepID=A0A2P2QKC8_RHIMU
MNFSLLFLTLFFLILSPNKRKFFFPSLFFLITF